MNPAPLNGAVLFALGATHRTTPLAVREKLAVSAETAAALHGEFTRIAGLREFAMLSTCNRVEFFGVAEHSGVVERVQTAFCARQNFREEEFSRMRLHLQNQDMVRHLFEVASGIDSQLVGETEIFGQIKAAYTLAQSRGSTGPVLNRVFQKAFQASKHVRTHTSITEGQVSIANVAVDLALKIFGSLGETRILLLGAGEIGEKTARAFQSRGALAMTVASRSIERAMALASSLDASALPFEHRETHLADFEVVVCATSAPDAVLSQAVVQAAMHKRPARPLFLIDLALPRDVEAGVAEMENVYLYNLDDLAKIAEANRVAREAEITECRAILAERSATLWRQIEVLLATSRPAPALGGGAQNPGV